MTVPKELIETFPENESEFCKGLEYCGRILEDPDYHVWGSSPIYDEDGKVHVFFSRWKKTGPHASWVISCEIGHAVADTAEGPFEVVDVALEGRGGDAWDAWSIHNPTVYKVDDKYVLLYMGSNGKDVPYTRDELSDHILEMEKQGKFHVPTHLDTDDVNSADVSQADEFAAKIWDCYMKVVESKRVGMAVADSLNGPWTRISDDAPMVDVGGDGEWDQVVTTNPAFMKNPNGQYWLYYKSWDWESWETRHGNRKYGLAIADKLEGPYTKYEGNPVVDFEQPGKNTQCEDAYIYPYDGEIHMITRDMGFFNNVVGLHIKSADGINWGAPRIGFYSMFKYSGEELVGMEREGRFERPQVLLKDGKPDYLFCATVGGNAGTSTAAVLKVNI